MNKKRKSSSTSFDKRLARIAAVVTIAASLIFIVGTVAALQLTTVYNPSGDPQLEAEIRIYADGQYYDPSTFDAATVSGLVTFKVDIISGEADAIELDIFEEDGTSPIVTEVLTQSTSEPRNWEIGYDTTQLENGVYWFYIVATLADGTSSPAAEDIVPTPEGWDLGTDAFALSVFGFEQSDDGGEGAEPPVTIPLSFIIVLLGIGAVIVIVVSCVAFSRR